jgi:small subunit ribosomal protein S15
MARMHSPSKGKSGSKRPFKQEHKWISHSKEELEKLIIKFSKLGKSQAEIGMLLRDQYGIPNIKEVTGTSISNILKKNNALPELPDDIIALIKKQIMLTKHLEKNHGDQTAKRGLILTQAKVKRLIKYYKRNKIIPQDWKYNEEQAKMLIG